MGLDANKVSSIDCGLSLVVHFVKRLMGRKRSAECRPPGIHFHTRLVFNCCFLSKIESITMSFNHQVHKKYSGIKADSYTVQNDYGYNLNNCTLIDNENNFLIWPIKP